MKENYYSWTNILKLKFLFLLLKSSPKLNDFSNTYIITGMPRGGTTWLAEIFNTIPNSLYLHEPLKTGRIKSFDRFLHDIHKYIPEDSNRPELKLIFDKLLKGEILNPALVERSKNLMEILNTSSLVIKFVRLNRILPWITNNYKYINTPVCIVRHPCAVVYSQMNHGSWRAVHEISYPYKIDFKDSSFCKIFGDSICNLTKINSVEQHLALAWCLDALPLFHKNNGRWITVSYENAVQGKERFVENLFDRLRLQMNEKTYEKLYIPSSSSQEYSPPSNDALKQITKWEKGLNSKQVDDIKEILDAFSIDIYNTKEPEPNYEKLEWFGQKSG